MIDRLWELPVIPDSYHHAHDELVGKQGFVCPEDAAELVGLSVSLARRRGLE